MLNQVVLVGRLFADPILRVTESGRKVSTITLAVPRTYKNVNGEYDTDFIKCTLWSGIAETTAEYCNKGDIVGVKARIVSKETKENDPFSHVLEIIAEKVTFLSSKKDK